MGAASKIDRMSEGRKSLDQPLFHCAPDRRYPAGRGHKIDEDHRAPLSILWRTPRFSGMPGFHVGAGIQQEECAHAAQDALLRERQTPASTQHLVKVSQHLLPLSIGEPSSPVYQMVQNVKSSQGTHPKLVKLATALQELPVLT